MNGAELGRLGRTMLRLRPAQLGQRVRLRAQRMALDHALPLAGRWLLAGPDPAAGAGWPAEFRPASARLWHGGQEGKALRAGELRLLGVTRVIATAAEPGVPDWTGTDWEAADAPPLWRRHLYSWDWAWALVNGDQDPDARALLTAIWESWHAAVVPGRGAPWHPCPAALRAWSFCGIYRPLVRGGAIEEPFRGELAALTGYLRRNLETDAGGSHLIKNLKALAGLAVFFADDALLSRVLTRLRLQLAIQVLPDGGHCERAPACHCQVLGDLIDIAGLLRAAGREAPPGLPEAITAMRRWLGAVLTPDGQVPLLNDGFPVSPEFLAELSPAPPPRGPLCLLRDSGLARARAGGWHLLADVGPPGPRSLPAPAHADTFSCVVHVDGEPLLIDTGTSTCEAGPVRDRERSTAAHNTLEVDRRDSTEVWGAFRAGREARVIGVSARVDASAGMIAVGAAHDGYRGVAGKPRHHRQWALGARELRVDDTVTGQGRHRIVVRWHLAPGTRLQLVPGGAVVITRAGQFDVTVTAAPLAGFAPLADPPPECELLLTAALAEVSTGFEVTVEAPVLACALHPRLPVRISTVWRLGHRQYCIQYSVSIALLFSGTVRRRFAWIFSSTRHGTCSPRTRFRSRPRRWPGARWRPVPPRRSSAPQSSSRRRSRPVAGARRAG